MLVTVIEKLGAVVVIVGVSGRVWFSSAGGL